MPSKSVVDEAIEVMEATAYQRDFFTEMAIRGMFASLILKIQCEQKDVLIKSFEKETSKHVKDKVPQHFNDSKTVKKS